MWLQFMKFQNYIIMSTISDLKLEQVKEYCKIIKQYCPGAYGRVYLVQKLNGCRNVIKKSLLQDKQYEKYEGINHEFIVTPIKSFEIQRYQFTIFPEWSGNLKQISHKISSKQLLIILKNLSSALSYLEEKNISHGDIKMSNILFMKKPFCVGLADFSYISQKQRQYRNDYMQLGLMIMEMIGYDYFKIIDIYEIDYIKISQILSINHIPENICGRIAWNMIQSGVNQNQKCSFKGIFTEINKIIDNHSKTKRARKSKGKLKILNKIKCKSCLKLVGKTNFQRHNQNCKGMKMKRI